jgi:hypothetical protein
MFVWYCIFINNMISKIVMRLEHGLVVRNSITQNLQTQRYLNQLPKIPIKIQKYIEFKNYTGNEILFTLKDYKKLHPGELSSGLLQLSLRKGVPDTYDWSTHPCIRPILDQFKQKIPQYTCRVLTSLALSLHRLRINDQEIWTLLENHIIRTSSTIDSTGLAYSFYCFIDKGSTEFYTNLVRILPVYINLMNSRDIINVIKGLKYFNQDDTVVFNKHIYPFILNSGSPATVSELKQCLDLLSNRPDFTPEFKAQIQKRITKKLSKLKITSFGGNEL